MNIFAVDVDVSAMQGGDPMINTYEPDYITLHICVAS